jgi:hypothetical protein
MKAYSGSKCGIPVILNLGDKWQWLINPLTPELNPSMQSCLTRFFNGDFAS